MIDLTIVIPIFNEEQSIPLLHKELQGLLEEFKKDKYKQGLRNIEHVEIIFVNDGSKDGSLSLMQAIAHENSLFRVISFSRNFGHQPAVFAGLKASRGKAVVIMDADLQDPPSLVVEMVLKWQEGFDVVYAVRERRETTFIMSVMYKIYYRFQMFLSDDPAQIDAGDFGLMDRRIVDIIRHLPEKEGYMRGLRSWVGFKQIGLKYSRKDRKVGESKYSFSKLCKLAFRGILSTSVKPLFLSGLLSLLSVIFAMGFIAHALIAHFIVPVESMPKGWTSLMIAVSILNASQLISIWLLSLYIAKIYKEILARPNFIIEYDSLQDKDKRS